MFINEKYYNPIHITTRHMICTKDIELLALKIRPHYLSREINQFLLFLVYIALSADTSIAAKTIHDLISQAETESPDAVKLIMGGF